MRQLIVNADDFGDSPWTNAAIILAFRRGIVTSTSLMVVGPAFEQAVRLARANPDLRVGLHLVFPHDQADLWFRGNSRSKDGRRSPVRGQVTAALKWLLQPGAREQLRRLIRAQVERFLATGLELDHLNSHHHFHIHPVVFEALLEVAAETGVRYIRLPAEPKWLSLWLDEDRLSRKLIRAVGFGPLAWHLRHRLKARGFVALDGVFGLLQVGSVHQKYLLGLLQTLPEGVYELCVHPDLSTTAGLRELQALTSPLARRTIRERGIRLTTYSDCGLRNRIRP